MNKITWEMQEAGWHTTEKVGICKETNGWYVYFTPNIEEGIGPYKTLAEAKQKAENWLGGEE